VGNPAVSKYLNKFSHNQTLYAARFALIVGGCFVSAGAKDAHTTITVGATVRAVARLELTQVPGALEISARDVAQGFIDVPETTQVSIDSNSAQGFALEFLTVAPLFSAMSVHGLDGEAALGAEGGMVVQRWQHAHPVNLALRYRFMLAPGLAAGTYPWPIRLSVRPLETI
jgi:hypothetical protein